MGDVHTDESTGEQSLIEMKGEYREHHDCAQAVDFCAIAAFRQRDAKPVFP